MSLYYEDRKLYDHLRYMAHREERLEAMKAYRRDYAYKGLKKPRKPGNRKAQQHDYYMRNRDRILARQKEYRETHKEKLKMRRRKRIERLWREHFEKSA